MGDSINKKELIGLGNWFDAGFAGDEKVKDHLEVSKLKDGMMNENICERLKRNSREIWWISGCSNFMWANEGVIDML